VSPSVPPRRCASFCTIAIRSSASTWTGERVSFARPLETGCVHNASDRSLGRDSRTQAEASRQPPEWSYVLTRSAR
jgi:hypothetical protein